MRRGGRDVVHDLSLQLRPGEWVAIVGPNGARKSSLLAGLPGLLPAAGGEVMLQGRPLAAWPVRERARRLAWLSQQGEAEGATSAAGVMRLRSDLKSDLRRDGAVAGEAPWGGCRTGAVRWRHWR